ncbi:hypothetical protein RHMOL_Rhmol03G0057600 [Rhododendron molle]|uniref:Uncharacterized protein n=1 Tax=Rhododendron molle TaxID=49168 RepID=A0ACC0PCF7_RHOML|nr:hypothetical protein RHMOL_Rhmol03G0057600 [Rhododendron molle]
MNKGGQKEGEQTKPGQQLGGQHKIEQCQGGQGQQYGGQQKTEQCQGGEGQRKEGGGMTDKVKDKLPGGGTGGTQDHKNRGV